MQTFTANQAKTHFGEFLDLAQREPVRVMRRDRVVGVMVSAVVSLAASGWPGSLPQTRKSNSIPSRSMPKTSAATPNSNIETGSVTITLTLCNAMPPA